MGRAAGRSKVRRLRRAMPNDEGNEGLMTFAEMAQMMQQSFEQWQRESEPHEDAVQRATLTENYVEFDLPDGRTWSPQKAAMEIMRNLALEPYPDIFRPPAPLGMNDCAPVPVFDPAIIFGPIKYPLFQDALPIIVQRVHELMNPSSCEGAVGYDQRYYEAPIMVQPLAQRPTHCRYKVSANAMLGKNRSWLDSRLMSRLISELNKPLAEFQKLQMLPVRLAPPSKPIKLMIGCQIKHKKASRSVRALKVRANIILQPVYCMVLHGREESQEEDPNDQDQSDEQGEQGEQEVHGEQEELLDEGEHFDDYATYDVDEYEQGSLASPMSWNGTGGTSEYDGKEPTDSTAATGTILRTQSDLALSVTVLETPCLRRSISMGSLS
ncbi:hypothetical protein KR018_003358 [Drosophila ironensis]|nr:hypothetical protein KR018_003358 [Drosophila ironensis]